MTDDRYRVVHIDKDTHAALKAHCKKHGNTIRSLVTDGIIAEMLKDGMARRWDKDAQEWIWYEVDIN